MVSPPPTHWMRRQQPCVWVGAYACVSPGFPETTGDVDRRWRWMHNTAPYDGETHLWETGGVNSASSARLNVGARLSITGERSQRPGSGKRQTATPGWLALWRDAPAAPRLRASSSTLGD